MKFIYRNKDNNSERMNKVTLPFLFVTLLFMSSFAFADTSHICLDAYTLNSTVDVTINGARTISSQLIYCNYGCNFGACLTEYSPAQIESMWLVYAIGMILLVLGTVLGMPSARLENTKPGIDTTMVIKYMFFFVGLYLVYMSLGMSRYLTSTITPTIQITGAIDTTTTVMTITLGLFIFIFVLEFVFTVLKMFKESAEQKKWGEREEE